MTQDVIEGQAREVVERALALQPEQGSVTLYGTSDPNAIVQKATAQANALAKVIKDKHLYATISGRDHVTVEGWTLLGSMLGVFPVVEWTRPMERDGKVTGWEARVEARTSAGAIVGAAEAMCSRSEKSWSNRDDYALRSMAQTRATSKAMRLPLSFVMTLAGFDATPMEEMPPAQPRAATGKYPWINELAPLLKEYELGIGAIAAALGTETDDRTVALDVIAQEMANNGGASLEELVKWVKEGAPGVDDAVPF